MFSNEIKRHWGFHPMQEAFFNSLKDENPNLVPARVVFSSHDHYKVLVLGKKEERFAKPRGHFYYSGDELPVVGDWVGVELVGGDQQSLPIESILPRLTRLRRQGSQRGYQTLIANVDYIALVTSFNQDLNERRLERGIAMIEDSGAKPIVVVNKSDLLKEEQITPYLELLQERFQNTTIVACSAKKGQGVRFLEERVSPGQSLAMVGMSGVGKSTLINSILGNNTMVTTEIRQDDSRGRHTTTHRELVLTEKGFWLMDTPGIRAFTFAGDEDALENAFEDISALMTQCRFADCSHYVEPGCKIIESLGRGDLSMDRWENFLKMKREMEFHAYKKDKAFQNQKKRAWAKIHVQLRKKLKERGRG